jgi:cation:H+ antiporter
MKLAEYGDAISIHTNLGGAFIGLLLMAGATSLPELLTSINSIEQSVPDLAAGNTFGSNMFNMLLIGIMGFISWRKRILRQVARKHALSGSIAAILIALSIFLIQANLDVKIGWVGLDSLLLIISYILGVYLIQSNSAPPQPIDPKDIDDSIPSLRKAVIGFSLATLALILTMPYLVSSSTEIAEITGLGAGFVGTVLVSFVTSLPEMVTTIAAIRLGVYDMAMGNLFGSNMFNIFTLGFADFFMTSGRFLDVISIDFTLVAMIGLIMTLLALIGNIAKLNRRFLLVEIDAALLVITYLLGMFIIYQKGIGL